MIKATLDLHDPIDIYDQLKTQFGNLTMLIKDGAAIITFENYMAQRAILQNPKKVIKGFPLTLRAFDQEQEEKRAAKKNNFLGQSFSSSMDLEQSSIQFQNTPLADFFRELNAKENIKTMKLFYEAQIKQIKDKYSDPQLCNEKINKFNFYVKKRIQINKTCINFRKSFRELINEIKRFQIDPESDKIQLDNSFQTPIENKEIYQRRSINNRSAPYFEDSIFNYSSGDIGSVKRFCLLNQENFVTTLRLNDKGYKKGQLRIYKKEKQIAEFSLDIEEGPYSLMVHQNFILTGDSQGHIHMIDLNDQNQCDYSNKLSYGLIVNMLKYETKTRTPSILTLLTGERNGERSDYKIKLFEIQNQKISNDINSLSFHPKDQILCEDVTMTLEVLNDGKFAYGCGKNTYICPSFNKYETQWVTHDQNVMKLKMKNPQQIIEATQRKIWSLDLRSYKLKNCIFEFKHDINNLELISDNYIFYGGKAGQVGVIDARKPNVHVWNPPQILHRGKISDILKMGEDVITGDSEGNIFGWKRKNLMI